MRRITLSSLTEPPISVIQTKDSYAIKNWQKKEKIEKIF